MILVIYSAWSSPFELAFKEVATGSLLPVDLVVDAFFAIDIILTFFVAYLDKSTYLLVDDHKQIAVRYNHIHPWGEKTVVKSLYQLYFYTCYVLAQRAIKTFNLQISDSRFDIYFS